MTAVTTSFGLARIGQIAITVRDLPRAVAFYRDVLGMTLLFEAPPGPYGWLADHCFVGIGERQKECLFMRYYKIL